MDEEERISINDRENVIFRIERKWDCSIDNYEEARQYFDTQLSYDVVESYHHLQEESGLETLYLAEEEDNSHYVLKYNDCGNTEYYKICVNDRGLVYDLISSTYDREYIECKYRKYSLEVGNGQTVMVEQEVRPKNIKDTVWMFTMQKEN